MGTEAGETQPGSASDRYEVKSVVRACEVLDAFRYPGEVLRLRDVVARTGIDKGTAFRLIYTLTKCGLLEKPGANQYRCRSGIGRRVSYRVGYASSGDNSSFDREVRQSFVQAAELEGIQLFLTDNRYSPKIALRAVERLIGERVDLIVEFQSDYASACAIGSKCAAAKIPLIAVEIPHPHAFYFGANNYQAGLIGGRFLGRWAKTHWPDPPDEIILVDQRRVGPVPHSRLAGTLAGIREQLPAAANCAAVFLDGDGDMGRSLAVVRNHLRFYSARRVLVAGMDDVSVLGALRAFEEAGRLECCAAVGQNAAPEGRAELRRTGTRFIGSVAYFPEKYGESLVHLALNILGRRQVPPAVFAEHCLITRENVDHFYPNDALMGYRS